MQKDQWRFDVAQFMKARKVALRVKAVSENCKLWAEYKKVQRAQEKVRWYKYEFCKRAL